MDKIRFGIAGAGGRPTAFLAAFEESNRAVLAAACDPNTEALEKALHGIEGVARFSDYDEMLQKGGLDAVIIGTPIPYHVEQSVKALNRGIHVYSEVTAAVSVEECRALLSACKASKAQYMLGENCNYMKPYMIIREMVKDNVFGGLIYAEGEYLHDCRELIDKTPWRKTCLYETPGVTYGTHSLGPILSWMENDRVESVSCVGSGRHNRDLNGNPIDGDDTSVMLCKTAQGRLIKVRMDLSSPQPYSLNYRLQGTAASYTGSHQEEKQDRDQVWISGESKKEYWDALSQYEEKYLPDIWRKVGHKAEKAGHGGSDVAIMADFIDAIYDGRPVPIGIYDALNMTLPGLISRDSVLQGGVWLPVPNPRQW